MGEADARCSRNPLGMCLIDMSQQVPLEALGKSEKNKVKIEVLD